MSRVVTLVNALVCLLLVAALSGTRSMRAFEDTLYAVRMALTPRPAPDPRVVVGAKDDATWSAYAGGKFGRQVFAAAIENAGAAGARGFGLDFILDQPREEDARLLEALALPTPVICGTEERTGRDLMRSGEERLRELAGQGSGFRSVSGPHPGIAPFVGEGFLNFVRGKALKAPVLQVELYRDGSPPAAGFAFALYLDHLVEAAWDRLGAAPRPPPAGDAGDPAWLAWLRGFHPEGARAAPRFPDPVMEHLLRRAEARALLRKHGVPRPPARVEHLAKAAGQALLPVVLAGPPPPGRALRIDYSGGTGTFPVFSLLDLADAAAFERLAGTALIRLDAGGTRRPFVAPGTPRGPHALTGALRGLPAGAGGRALAVHRRTGATRWADLGAGGDFALPGLPPGRVDLVLTAPLAGGNLTLSVVREAVPVPGPGVEVALPPLAGSLAIEAPEGTTIALSDSDLEGPFPPDTQVHLRGSFPAAAGGTTRLEGLLPGEYAGVLPSPAAAGGPPGFGVTGGTFAPPARPPSPPLRDPAGGASYFRVATGELHRTGSKALELPPDVYVVLREDGPGEGRAWIPGADALRDRIVVMGTTMESDQDAFPTPVALGAEGDVAGVEIHANALSNLLAGRVLHEASPLANLALAAATLLACGAAFHALSPIPAFLAGLALLGAAFLLSAVLLVTPGLYLRVGTTLVAGGLFLASELAIFLRGARQEAKYIREMFGRCVDPVLRDRLLETPDLVLQGEARQVTVLFSDVRGFTTLSEKLTPEELVECLNSYFSRVTPVFLEHGGVFDKYIGDAFMGFFGAPLEQPDHADRALRAALAMLAEKDRWKAEREAAGLPGFDVGFGINTGLAIAGAIGGEASRVNYSVLGDAVNVAARLESLCKEHAATILTSGATLRACDEAFDCVDLGEVQVKGRKEPVRVYKLHPIEEADLTESSAEWDLADLSAGE